MSGQPATVLGVPPKPRTAPQRSVGVPDELWREAAAIAKAKNEIDLIGKGVAVVVRRALKQYVARHRDLLPDDLRD